MSETLHARVGREAAARRLAHPAGAERADGRLYAGHFGLQQDPFSLAPDPRYLFMSDRHREALAHLLYGLRGGGGFVLLTGEIGAGKTTVCRCFLDQVPANCNVAYIFNPKLSVLELLQAVCDEFGITVTPRGGSVPTVKDHTDPLNEFLLRAHAAGRHNVLIIDEAQSLDAEVLEQLRLLTNLETNERKLLQIILIGQPELRDLLARPELEQLAQRIVARYHLDALSESETAYYIRHRLAVAGMSGVMPFDREARHRIHELTRGVPRRINLLCDRALLGAYVAGSSRADRSMVDRAAAEVFGQVPRSTAGAFAAVAPWGWAALTAGGVLLATAAAWHWWTREPAPTTSPAAASPAAAPPAASPPAVAPPAVALQPARPPAAAP